MYELYLSITEEIAYVGDVVSVMVSNLLPPLPYQIYVDDVLWIDGLEAPSKIVYHDYTCTSPGIHKFKAWMAFPSPRPPIWSNEDVLTVFSGPPPPPPPPPDGNGERVALIAAACAVLSCIATVWFLSG